MSLLFALINESALITARDLFRLCAPLELQGQQVASDWSLQAPAVVPWDTEAALTTDSLIVPVVFVDELPDDGSLAYHWFDDARMAPACRVFCKEATGLNEGGAAIVTLAGHEIAETLPDPTADLWMPMPGRQGIEVAKEIADPVQDSYRAAVEGTDWQLANYVRPAWFQETAAADASLDRLGEIKVPGGVLSSGYLILRESATGRVFYEDHAGAVPALSARHAASIRHPHSRTFRRLGGKLAEVPT